MKTKKVLSILLALLLVIGCIPTLGVSAYAKDYQGTTIKASVLKTGDIIQIGNYPQKEVKDSALIAKLNKVTCKMSSYGYMKNADEKTLKFETIDMTYADIIYNGSKYRKIRINEYRPKYTGSDSTEDNTEQDNNGYIKGHTYYFKWMPIVWQVLAKENDGVYIISKTILDSQTYNNDHSVVTWSNCTLRDWLSKSFYNVAFSANEKNKICSITHENEDNTSYKVDGGPNTTDNIWILSIKDASKSAYGFSSDTDRVAKGSDYAKSQGLYVNNNTQEYLGCSDWRLRTPGCFLYGSSQVCISGLISDGSYRFYSFTDEGIRPAMKLKLNSEISKSDPVVKNNTLKKSAVKAPAKTEIKSLKAKKKAFAASWKTVKNVSGYQLQYSTKKNMKGQKTKTLKGAKKAKITVKKLKAKKKYYVRVRTFKVVNGKKVYSKWSAKKVVKTK